LNLIERVNCKVFDFRVIGDFGVDREKRTTYNIEFISVSSNRYVYYYYLIGINLRLNYSGCEQLTCVCRN